MKCKWILVFFITVFYVNTTMVYAVGETYKSHEEGLRDMERRSRMEADRKVREQVDRMNKLREEDRRRKEEDFKKREDEEKSKLRSLEAAGKKFDEQKRRMPSNERKIKETDERYNLFERKHIRKNVINSSKEAARFAEKLALRVRSWNEGNCYYYNGCYKIDSRHKWNESNCYAQAREYREYADRLKQEIVVLDKDIKNKFDEIKREMATNDAKIKAADETNDLLEKIHVRKDIIKKSAKAFAFIKDYIENDAIEKISGNGKSKKKYMKLTKQYGENLSKIERSLLALGKDFKKKFGEIERDMATNDAQIKAADETNDLSERRRVRSDIIQKSDRAAAHTEIYINEFCKKDRRCDVNKYKKIANRYRNYQNRVEKDLPAIQNDINALEKNDGFGKIFARTGHSGNALRGIELRDVELDNFSEKISEILFDETETVELDLDRIRLKNGLRFFAKNGKDKSAIKN